MNPTGSRFRAWNQIWRVGSFGLQIRSLRQRAGGWQSSHMRDFDPPGGLGPSIRIRGRRRRGRFVCKRKKLFKGRVEKAHD